MNSAYFAKKFIQLFPEHEQAYAEHFEDYGEILGHVFFGDAIDALLFELLLENSDTESIQKYVDFIEDMYVNGDFDVQNVVELTIVAYLGDNEIVLRNLFMHCSEVLINVSKKVEAKETGYGRWEIHTYWKKGKMYVDVNGVNWVVKNKFRINRKVKNSKNIKN